MPAGLLLREDDLPVGEHVELALLPRDVDRVVAVRLQFGRETRGPFVVPASDRAVVDLDGHGANCRHWGPSSETDRQPESASVRSKSATKLRITSRAPCSPPSARPYTYGRPTSTAVAPRASALKASAPPRTPLSRSTGTRPATTSTTAGSASSDPIEPSTCRPPWFETTIPSRPCSTASLASPGWRIPLTTIGSLVRSRSHVKSSHVSEGRE